MGEAVGEAERAGTILHHLRGLVEKGELQRTAQALNEIIHDAARLAVAEAEQENIHVSLELEDGLPHVVIDKIESSSCCSTYYGMLWKPLSDLPSGRSGSRPYAARTERSKSRSEIQAQASTRAWLISCLPSISDKGAWYGSLVVD